MAVDGVSTYLRLPKQRRRGYLRFLIFSGVILVASSINLILDVWGVFDSLFKAGPGGRSYIETFRKDAYDRSSSLNVKIIGGVMGDATLAAGDILLLWRCFILWSSTKWVTLLPCLACVGSIVARMICLILMSTTKYLVEGPAALASIAGESLSVSMKVMVTGLILFELTRTWLLISRSCPSLKRSPTYTNVAAIVIESAAPLAICGLCYIIVTALVNYHAPTVLAKKGTLNALSEVSSSLYVSFSALSPQMIIFRVLNGRSWKNARESNELTEKLSTTLRFATPHSNSTEDIDADSAHRSTLGR
ncbi:hypothetical protein BKA70DRAFT_1263739 [Coprinopsis sp. MPI-PUGE-AT-0042]|nr:hypothetical protein BKA70DRAFT_1263739 [Coprinopsis sp. MPI-PUGE-AT-0042]